MGKDGGLADAVQLIALIRQGDPAGMQALHDGFSDRIFFLALNELRSKADAEDVRNETLVRVMEAVGADRLQTPAALPGFVLATARNIIRESLRKGQRVESIADQDFRAESHESVVDHTIKRVMETVIGRLKPRERDFLRLYYYDELPKAEISRQLGIDQERVRLIKSRALKSFREIYQRLTKA